MMLLQHCAKSATLQHVSVSSHSAWSTPAGQTQTKNICLQTLSLTRYQTKLGTTRLIRRAECVITDRAACRPVSITTRSVYDGRTSAATAPPPPPPRSPRTSELFWNFNTIATIRKLKNNWKATGWRRRRRNVMHSERDINSVRSFV